MTQECIREYEISDDMKAQIIRDRHGEHQLRVTGGGSRAGRLYSSGEMSELLRAQSEYLQLADS